jgi:hypothetical protein
MMLLGSRTVVRVAIAATLTIGTIGSTWLQASATTPAYTFFVFLRNTCVSGGGPASTAFSLEQIARNGTPIQTKPGNTAPSGEFTVCFTNSVRSRQTLFINDGVDHRSFTIPVLTAAANRVTDVVSGRAPAGVQVRVGGTHHTGFGLGSPIPQVNTTANSKGHFSADLSAKVNLLGADYYSVVFTTKSGDLVEDTGSVPFMSPAIGEASVYGTVNRGQAVTITERTAAGTLKGSGHGIGSTFGGDFSVQLADKNNATVLTRPGDRVSGSFASDATLRIPRISVKANSSTDTVTGNCRPHMPFSVFASNKGGGGDSLQTGTTAADGTFSVDMSSGSSATFDLKAGDGVVLRCRFASGDRVSKAVVAS